MRERALALLEGDASLGELCGQRGLALLDDAPQALDLGARGGAVLVQCPQLGAKLGGLLACGRGFGAQLLGQLAQLLQPGVRLGGLLLQLEQAAAILAGQPLGLGLLDLDLGDLLAKAGGVAMDLVDALERRASSVPSSVWARGRGRPARAPPRAER